ncbi:MAG: hypothetical protein HKP12_09015 [Gammaproteobacteria bacterium]|nr:hypothetical protein [Gammaproteobacteria bacterium]
MKSGKRWLWAFGAFSVLYLVLLIPDSKSNVELRGANTAFRWNEDPTWYKLENKFSSLRNSCEIIQPAIAMSLNQLRTDVNRIDTDTLSHDDAALKVIRRQIFEIAAMISACPDSALPFIQLTSDLRVKIKTASIHWNTEDKAARESIYRILYGSRAAAEEILLQADRDKIPLIVKGSEVESVAPEVVLNGVQMRSGDILVSRGGAPTSALIARGNDYPGNFSHVGLLYVDPETSTPWMIESHIEVGVTISDWDTYMNDKKLRIMVLRVRPDLNVMKNDPMIPHKAAAAAWARANKEHIAYDFAMDFKNPDKLFCSEVASSVYRQLGINLWMGISHISSPGTVQLLQGFGVEFFQTEAPSDLEYDTQLTVVGELRDPQTLYQDHVDNAVVDAILEMADAGWTNDYNVLMLPPMRVVKGYCMILNHFGTHCMVPEGMSATSALRHDNFVAVHSRIKTDVLKKAAVFELEKGYRPPFWRLYEMAVDVSKQELIY